MKKITSALISVYYKDQLESLVRSLEALQITIYSTGGTQQFIEQLGVKTIPVEQLTSYPSILGGRVKTLHPALFGGILARRDESSDQLQLQQYHIPPIDLVVVDLYPFEETAAQTSEETEVIEKIDIGGVSLIRAAAKNYRDVVVIASRNDYEWLISLLREQQGCTTLEQRKHLAAKAFNITSHYDTTIFNYFNATEKLPAFKQSYLSGINLRYGENPHQLALYFGPLHECFEILNGKELSFNNLVDIDAAINLIAEFSTCAFAIIKHTNACGVAVRPTTWQAWKAALAADPVSAFGGILVTNSPVDIETAQAISDIFFEVLIAPDYADDALQWLRTKKNRIILRQKNFTIPHKQHKTILNGIIMQDADWKSETADDLKVVTNTSPTSEQIVDLLFANKCVKHLKSNAIVLAKQQQMLAMGCGHTSRIEALKHAIEKALRFGFDLKGAVMASDAFFPFPDCVETAYQAGISAVIQPGGSVRDQDSIDFCNAHGMTMVFTGFRHFRH